MNHLIILPGWQQHAQHWEMVSRLLEDANVPHTIIDLPGFGTEPYDQTVTDLQAAALWVQRKIDSFHIEQPIVLVGHSFGGRVAVALAHERTGSFTKMILIGSPNLYMPTLRTRILSIASKAIQPFKRYIPEHLRSRFRSDDYSAIRNTSMQKLFSSTITSDQSEKLTKLTVPTQLLWGRNDTQAPLKIALKMQALIPNSTLEIIEEAGHDLHIEKPHLLASKLAAYAKA